MGKLLVVFGATGQQGGSIIKSVLADAELSKQYRLRAITRDTSSSTCQALSPKGVEVVQADVNDASSLPAALKGAHTVFMMGSPTMGPGAKAHELNQGKAVADAAVTAGASYYIFSTLPHVERGSGGKYTKVTGFDAKAETEEYIRTLPMKSAFFAPGSFMQNWQNFMLPRPTGDGSYVVARHVSPKTQLPLIDTAGDTGKFVGAILADPEKYEGKVFCAATALYSMEQIVEIISKKSGKTVRYQQIPVEDFVKFVGSPYAPVLAEMMSYQQDFGYYGPDTKEKVAWAAANARGKVTTFEEYLDKNPLPLE